MSRSSRQRRYEQQRYEQASQEGTALERAFGFRDPAFTDYIIAKNLGKSRRRTLSHELGQNNHPIVQVAAGSIAMWLAVHRDFYPTDSAQEGYEARQADLRVASKRWADAAAGLRELHRPYHRLTPNISMMEFRLTHARAYLPLAEIIAAGLEEYNLPPDVIQKRHQQTSEALASLGEQALAIPPNCLMNPGRRRRFIAEMACGVVTRFDEAARFVGLPPSFRQFYAAGPRHADMVALSTDPIYPNPRISFSANPSKLPVPGSNFLSVNIERDLTFGVGHSVDETLQTFVNVVRGNDGPTVESLGQLGNALGDRLMVVAEA